MTSAITVCSLDAINAVCTCYRGYSAYTQHQDHRAQGKMYDER